jgi:RNA-directed DNA polymerase
LIIPVILLDHNQFKSDGRMNNELTKSIPVSKQMVWEGYLQVKANRGGAGIDKESLEAFEVNLSDNLYKIWNRLTSGSYFPPAVRTVYIPKKQGGQRPLGIPTVSDRIAQTAVKNYVEPALDKQFHESSFGYRPGKSAHDAVTQCERNCHKYAWLIEIDIKGYFDSINHDILKQLLADYIPERWVRMYLERWLAAGVEQEDGRIEERKSGTPQGGVVSPLLANLYLHDCFDKWMSEIHKDNPFERYADDMVVHCQSKEEALLLLEAIRERMAKYGLTLQEEKTKIVYCKDYRRNKEHENISFTFLGFDFQPRMQKSKREEGGMFMCFRAAISKQSKKKIREVIHSVLYVKNTEQSIETIAKGLNDKLRGWINYYGKFGRQETYEVLWYLNGRLVKWIRNKYRIPGVYEGVKKYNELKQTNPKLFYHWRLGIN